MINKIILILMIHGCSQSNAPSNPKFVEICYEGVVYITHKKLDNRYTYGYMSVKMNQDSEVVRCTSEPSFEGFEE